jgi:hypothetical protein
VADAVFVPNPAGILALKISPTEPVYKDLLRRVLRVDAAAKALCPVDTGRLRASIKWAIEAVGGALVGFIGTDVNYAKFVHGGTKGGTIIRPVHKRALYWAGADHPVASVVRGATRAQPFLADALRAAA